MRTHDLKELDLEEMKLIYGGNDEGGTPDEPSGEEPNPTGYDGIGEGSEYGPYGRKKWMPMP